VQIAEPADAKLLENLNKGLRMEDGDYLRAKSAGILRKGERNSWLVIVLDEGKNRQIRRMLEAVQIEVLRLVRVTIGPLELGDLPKGVSRLLRANEKRALDAAMRKQLAV
jgi:23S rRNA pseudouridine2605 synthase